MNTVIESYKKRSEGNTSALPLPPRLLAQRTAAQQQWAEEGFPTQRAENWKYTSLHSLEKTYFEPYPTPSSTVDSEFSSHTLDNAFTACFYNGYYCEAASTLQSLPPGVIIAPMSQAFTKYNDVLEQHYGQLLSSKTASIIPFNETLWQDGLLVFVPQGITVEPIIQLLYINDGSTTPCSSHLHHLIILEAEAQATLLEEYSYRSQDAEKTLTTVVTEIHLNDNSHCTHTRLQNTHHQHTLLTNTQVQQHTHSKYHHHSYDMGAILNRNDIAIQLKGYHAHCHLQGLYHVNKRQHIDNHINIYHRVPHTTSTEHYKGILDDKGRAVFNGAVEVAHGAFKTYAQQYNHNLLLSDKAEIDTKPQLEIYADDVRCSHGATVGQLNEDALFYLESRGIPETLARHILIAGFAHAIIEEQPLASIKHKAIQALQQKFPHKILEVVP